MPSEQPALNQQAPVAEVLPETMKAALPEVKSDYGAGDYWTEEASTETEKPAVAEAPKVEAPAVEPVVEVKSLASKWGAKVKAPAADVAALVKPKTEAAPAAPVENPEDKLELDKAASPRSRENFKVMKGITNTLREQLAAKERELAEVRSKPATAAAPVDNTEFERLKAEHKAMSDKLLLIDTQNHPVFQSQYVKPRNEKLAAATEHLKALGKDADLAKLIERPRGEIGKALQEIIGDLSQFDQAEISANVRDAHKLLADEKLALANAGQLNGAVKQNDAQTHAHAFEATWSKRLGDVSEGLEPADIPANATPQQRQALEAYNAAMSPEAIRAEARKIATGSQTYESISDASIKAVMYDRHIQHVMPRINAEFESLLSVVKAQKAEIDGYRSRNPNREISPSAAQSRSTQPATIEEAAAATWGR